MRRILFFCFAFFSMMQVSAQGTIKGKLIDSSSRQPLRLATVSVFKAQDTVLITYRLTNNDGDFRVPNIPLNTECRVIISYSGYDVFRKEFTMTNDIDLGTIGLAPVSKTLDEVLVIAERPPVTVRKDTIEFNASSFKTLPTALVEDLLRKLPGVEVDREGNILANGKRVNRILVDGKAFFGDDPKMATRNLPSNVIDKVQVLDDKEEADRNADGDLSNVGKVINLTLKKGIKKGWFGKAYAGAGTSERFEVGGIANIYRDTMQLSLLAFSNNINRSGFSMKEVQDLGGFNRSGTNSMMMTRRGSQEGFALNGISFGGLEPGVSTSTGAGFNFNHAPNRKQTLFLQYFFGMTNNHLEESNNTQQFLHDTLINSRTLTNRKRDVFTHSINTGGNFKPDSLTDLSFRAGLNISTTDENTVASIEMMNNKIGRISDGSGDLFNDFKNKDYNHFFSLTRRFRAKKGRTLNVFQNVYYRSSVQQYITESDRNFYYPAVMTLQHNQMRAQEIPTLSASGNINFAEPLNKKFTLRFNNRYEFLRDEQDVSIFSKNILTNKYDSVLADLVKGFLRTQNKFNTNLTLAYTIKKSTISAGASAMWQDINNRFVNSSERINQNLFNILPVVSFNRKQLNIRYDMSVNAPHISYLNPVPDSTNPFNIRYGNAHLQPARRHNFNVNNFSFFAPNATSLNIYMNANFIDNDVVMSRTVSAEGIQTFKPVNVNGTIQFYGNIGYGKEFKNNPKFIYSVRVSPFLSYDERRMIVNSITSTAKVLQYGPSVTLSLNWNDKIEFRPEYRPSFGGTSYTDKNLKTLETTNHYLESEFIVRWPKRFVWETNLAYRYTSQVPAGMPKENTLWNAAVTFIATKDHKGLLKLSVFDILDQNNSLFRYTNTNQIIDLQNNVLNRYAHLTFTYNIRNTGMPKKVGGRDRLLMF